MQKDAPANLVSIGDEDIQALMEVTSGLGNDSELDLILHSPGGSPDAAEAIVSYLRSRFSHIRVIVPNLAMSAATMISCAADELIDHKLKVKDLEEDDRLQDLVLSVFHATTHTFSGTGVTKIVENHTGQAFMKGI